MSACINLRIPQRSYLCVRPTQLLQTNPAVTALNTTILQGKTCRNLLNISYQHRGEANHLAVYATWLKEICPDTWMSLALCQEFQSQICIPAWRALSLPYMAIFLQTPCQRPSQSSCTWGTGMHRVSLTSSSWHQRWDTMHLLALLYLLCGFSQLITTKTSSLSSYKNLLFQSQKLCYTEALISLLNPHETYNQLQLQVQAI